jgi:hypothetical protein
MIAAVRVPQFELVVKSASVKSIFCVQYLECVI